MQIPNYFDNVRDFRVQGRCLHRLGDILGLVLCGTLADCDDFSEMVDYAEDNAGFLREELGFGFPNGIPSEDTLDRVIRHLSREQSEGSFKACLRDIGLSGKHLCVDGPVRGRERAGRHGSFGGAARLGADGQRVGGPDGHKFRAAPSGRQKQ